MRIGVLGGTFDPIHRGHTHLAQEISRVFKLQKVIFMVSKYPPHKGAEKISAAFHRYAMVVLELNREDAFFASSQELDREGPSYTFDTLEELSSSFPEDQFCFIAGSDSLQELSLWNAYDKLISRHCLIFVQRPGAEVDLDRLVLSPDLRDRIYSVRENVTPAIKGGVTYLLNVNAPSISSTEIREIISSGQRPSTRVLSSPVYRYIRKCQLYEQE